MDSTAEVSLNTISLYKHNYITRDWSYAESETSSISRRPSIDRSRRQILPINRFDSKLIFPNNKKRTRTISPVRTWNPKKEFTIESILDCDLMDDNVIFLVKWLGYPDTDNTWENIDMLRETLMLEKYLESACLAAKERIEIVNKKFTNKSVQKSKQQILEIMNHCQSYDELLHKSHHLIYLKVEDNTKNYKNFKRQYRRQVIKQHYLPILDKENERFNKFIREIRILDNFQLKFKVENFADFGEMPKKFIYINKNKFHHLLSNVEKESGIGCNCGQECSISCCCQPKKRSFSYSKNKKLKVQASEIKIIYECNDACSCGPDCNNRVTQQNPNLHLCLFKTLNGRGWGVKTLKAITTGSFVMEYTGELINFNEVERRGAKEYNKNDTSYLFDLDFDTESKYTVDATHYGNFSRFFNHSCEPNCAIWPVSTISAHKSVYKLCFFALRKILPNEELTFSYFGGGHVDENMNDSEKRGGCLCGTKSCRGYLFKI